MSFTWKGIVSAIRTLESRIILKGQIMGLEEAGRNLSTIQEKLAPVKYGPTRKSTQKGGAGNIWMLDIQEPSLEIGTRVAHNGASYPAVLDENPAYHYAKGPWIGARTQGWFTDADKRDPRAIDDALMEAALEIAKEWSN